VLDQNPTGLILDLRGNPGGYLDTAIEVVSQFISEGVVMLERFGDGEEKTYAALGGGLATEIPLVVLIDKGSASASEIVAGAVQDRGRGTLVGETSFGKGSVQTSQALAGDGGLRLTIARWLTPDGHWIHEQGIEPDVAVERTEEDRAAQRDPQLEKAIEILLGK
jgi:carboxyl-terminal processing protease